MNTCLLEFLFHRGTDPLDCSIFCTCIFDLLIFLSSFIVFLGVAVSWQWFCFNYNDCFLQSLLTCVNIILIQNVGYRFPINLCILNERRPKIFHNIHRVLLPCVRYSVQSRLAVGAALQILTGWIAGWFLEHKQTWNGRLCFEEHINYDFCFLGPN